MIIVTPCTACPLIICNCLPFPSGSINVRVRSFLEGKCCFKSAMQYNVCRNRGEGRGRESQPTNQPLTRTQINISEEPQVGTEPGSFLCFVNVKNLLDVPVAEVLGLESRGQTGCSWVRRPPRQRLTRLIEEHIV